MLTRDPDLANITDSRHTMLPLWGKLPDLQKQEIENKSIFLASWMYLMVLIDNSSFFVIKHCTFNV